MADKYAHAEHSTQWENEKLSLIPIYLNSFSLYIFSFIQRYIIFAFPIFLPADECRVKKTNATPMDECMKV